MSELLGIRSKDPEALRARAWISETIQITEPHYEPGAVVPIGHCRRRPTQAEFQPFLADERTPEGGTIEVIHFTGMLRAYLQDHERKLAPTVCRADQLTTTENADDNNLRPGLHLDSKEDRPAATRLESQRRIGLNFGPGLRYLLIGSVDAVSLTQQLGKPDTHTPTTGDVHDYAELYAGDESLALRCLWLPLRAGEAYIAPTEMSIHDGSTYAEGPSTIKFWIGAPAVGTLGSAI